MTIDTTGHRFSAWLRRLSPGDKASRNGAQPSRTPEGALIYAVGDIHGRSDLLEALLDQIRADRAATPHLQCTLIFLGDYVDRGFASKDVIEVLLRLANEPEFGVIALKGNHEEAMLSFLEDAKLGPGWAQHGGLETLLSYGVAPPSPRADAQEWEQVRLALIGSLPAAHLDFLNDLALMEVSGDYVFVHAGIRPGVALHRQQPDDLLWIRDDFLNVELKLTKTVVHGHTPNYEPMIGEWRVGVDTGAYATGVLTALRLEGDQRRFLQTGSVPDSVEPRCVVEKD